MDAKPKFKAGAGKEILKDSRARESGVAIYPCIQEKEFATKN